MFQLDPMGTIEECLAASFLNIFFVQKFMKNMGTIENFVMVADMRQLGVYNIPYHFLRDVLGFIALVIKGRSRAVYILNAPTTFKFLWSTCKFFLDANTVRKTEIVRGNTCHQLLELVDPGQLEQKYGGQVPDRQPGQFWPPSLPSMNFGVGL